MGITVDVAQEPQAEAVIDIMTEAARWLIDTGRPMWRLELFDHARIRTEVADGQYLLAEVDGQLAGTVRMQLSDREFWPEIPDGESVFLHQLAVRPSYRRSGISDAIVAHSAELTQRLGRRFLRLDCAVDRVKLRLLYERLGFRRHSDIVAGEWHVARFEMEVARPRAG